MARHERQRFAKQSRADALFSQPVEPKRAGRSNTRARAVVACLGPALRGITPALRFGPTSWAVH